MYKCITTSLLATALLTTMTDAASLEQTESYLAVTADSYELILAEDEKGDNSKGKEIRKQSWNNGNERDDGRKCREVKFTPVSGDYQHGEIVGSLLGWASTALYEPGALPADIIQVPTWETELLKVDTVPSFPDLDQTWRLLIAHNYPKIRFIWNELPKDDSLRVYFHEHLFSFAFAED